jgi:hypothetical protein
MSKETRLNAAADGLTCLAIDYICEPANWPVFAAWCSQQPGSATIPGTPEALKAVRAILVQRSAASILGHYGTAST